MKCERNMITWWHSAARVATTAHMVDNVLPRVPYRQWAPSGARTRASHLDGTRFAVVQPSVAVCQFAAITYSC